MTTTVFLALDTFFHHWGSDNRRAWLGIQPYINGSPEEVADWISRDDNILTGSNSTFKIAEPGDITPQAIPVPLPGKLPVRLELLNRDHKVLAEMVVDRARHCMVTDAQRLRQLNQFSSQRNIGHTLANHDNQGIAYPVLFTSTLAQSIRPQQHPKAPAPISAAQLAENLQLKFELGQRQKFDEACLQNVGDYFNAAQQHDQDFTQVTNSHYLLGQLINLGGDIDALRQVSAFRLSIGKQTLPIADGKGTTAGIFGSIQKQYQWDDFRQSLSWFDLSRRVNAKVQGDTFSVNKLGNSHRFLWRLSSKDTATSNADIAGNNVRWNAFERLDIREKSDVASSLLTHPEFEDIDFTPAFVMDVELVRFRKTPQVLPAAAELPPAEQNATDAEYQINAMLVAMQPTSAEKTRFDKLVSHHPELLSNAMLMVQDAQLTDLQDQSTTASYRITPKTYGVYQFPWEADTQCLWFFETEQNAAAEGFPDNVEFDFNQHIYQKVQLVIPLQQSLRLTRAGMVEWPANSGQWIPDRADPFGPRWEYWHTPGEQSASRKLGIDFNALFCPQLDQHEIDLDQLIVTAFHNDKYDYELAQSARRLEAVVQASFYNIRETDFGDLASFDFQQTVIEDKTNHNQLNLYERRTDYTLTEDGLDSENHIEHRNNGSALPCIKQLEQNTRDPLKKHLHYSFMGVVKDSTSVPSASSDSGLQDQVQNQLGREDFSAREFYVDVYQNLGMGRTLSVNLEHTYGSTILDTDIDGIPNPIDEPILLASDVAFSLNTPGQPSPTRNLLEVSLTQASGIEMLTLHINRDFLDEQWLAAAQEAEVNERALAHIQAWQGFAELYFAQDATLIAECYDFDIHQFSGDNSASALQQGLALQSVPLPALSQQLNALVAQAFVSLQDLPQSLSVPTGGNWGRDYHAVRIRLDVTRQHHLVPDPDQDWQIHRRLARFQPGNIEALYTLEGVKTERIDIDRVDAQLNQFLTGLRNRGGYLTPRDRSADKSRNQQFFALLGEGARFEHVAASSNAWIVPTALKRSVGDIRVAYCPVGITPIAADPRLKRDTSPVIRHYFSALQAVVDCQPYQWYNGDAQTLKNRIDWLADAQNAEGYHNLIQQAQRKFKAIPDANVAPHRLQQPVRQLAQKLTREQDPVKQSLTAKVTTLLQQQPSLFGTLKGLNVTNVSGADRRNGYQIRPDFFNLHQQKYVNEELQTAGQLGAAQLLHSQRASFTYWEQLDDNQFDNQFTLTKVRGETAERLFEQQPAGTEQGEFHIRVQQGKVFVPDKQPRDIGEAQVRLTSRRPVHSPVLGVLKQTSVAAQLSEAPDPQTPFNLADLLSAKLVTATQVDDKVMYVRDRQGAAFSQHLDKVIVSAVYRITGDEESGAAQMSDAFANDAFFVLVTDDPQHNHMPPLDANGHNDLSAIAELPENPRPLALQSGLAEKVFDQATMTACAEILAREPSSRQLPAKNDTHKAFCIRHNDAQQTLDIVDKSDQFANPERFDCNVWLFQNEQKDTIVWLEVELPIWQKRHISLVQTRNQAGFGDPQQQIFAPEFATISDTVGGPSDRMTQYAHFRHEFNDQNSEYPPVVVDGSASTPLAFVRAVLGNYIDDLDRDFPGINNQLNITIKEDSSSAFPTHVGGNTRLKVYNGSFARFTHRIPADTDENNPHWSEQPIDWFGGPRQTGRWRIDFEWRNPATNDEILRIEDFPVTCRP